MFKIAWVAHVDDMSQAGIESFLTRAAAREYEKLIKECYGESLVSTKLIYDMPKGEG